MSGQHLVGQSYFILIASFHKIVSKGAGKLGQKMVCGCDGSPGFASAALTVSLSTQADGKCFLLCTVDLHEEQACGSRAQYCCSSLSQENGLPGHPARQSPLQKAAHHSPTQRRKAHRPQRASTQQAAPTTNPKHPGHALHEAVQQSSPRAAGHLGRSALGARHCEGHGLACLPCLPAHSGLGARDLTGSSQTKGGHTV